MTSQPEPVTAADLPAGNVLRQCLTLFDRLITDPDYPLKARLKEYALNHGYDYDAQAADYRSFNTWWDSATNKSETFTKLGELLENLRELKSCLESSAQVVYTVDLNYQKKAESISTLYDKISSDITALETCGSS